MPKQAIALRWYPALGLMSPNENIGFVLVTDEDAEGPYFKVYIGTVVATDEHARCGAYRAVGCTAPRRGCRPSAGWPARRREGVPLLMVHFDDSNRQAHLDGAVGAFAQALEGSDPDPELHAQFKEWALDFRGRHWTKLRALPPETQLVLMPFIQVLASRNSFDNLTPRGQKYITALLAEVGMHPPPKKGSDGTHRSKWVRR